MPSFKLGHVRTCCDSHCNTYCNNCDSHCNKRQCDQAAFSKLENLENQKIYWTRKARPTFTNAQWELIMEHMLRYVCSDCRLLVSKLTKDIAKVKVISGS